jgi:hypothetical protein
MVLNKRCRLCKSSNLVEFLNLGRQYFTGIFPRNTDTVVPSGDLILQRCETCSLVQLAHTYDKEIMYGMNYGYQSSLNESMKRHLESIARFIKKNVQLKRGDIILDIGSNDGTFLSFFGDLGLVRIGIDPTIAKFASSYAPGITKVPDFFSKATFKDISRKPAKFISSISMMYDLDDPISFASDIADCLDPDGAWFFEQSYLGLMLDRLAYDTICHEHLEYYSGETIKKILDSVGLIVKKMNLNDTNGGSIAILAVKRKKSSENHCKEFQMLLNDELESGINTRDKLITFGNKVEVHRNQLKNLIEDFVDSGKKVFALGASTKGNVLLQYCELDSTKILAIGEVNEDKFECITPGTRIPIVSESEVFNEDPEVLLILPWHFKETFLRKTVDFVKKGGVVVFPLPELQILQNSL